MNEIDGKSIENQGSDSIFIECGIFSCEKTHSTAESIPALYSSNSFDICFVVSGSGIHTVLNQEIPCAKGDICIIPPGISHGYFLLSKNDSLTVRQIRFNLSDWFSGEIIDPNKNNYCYGLLNENPNVAYATLNSYMQDRVYSLFDYIECEILEKNNEWQEVVRGYLANLLISMGRYINSAIKSVSFISHKEWNKVSEMISIIKTEYSDNNLTLDSLSKRLYVSKSQLSRYFAKNAGMTFSDFLRNVRIKQVTKLLRETDENIEQIAENCGFHSMAAFYKAFNTENGMTPGEYRQKEQQNYFENKKYMQLLKGEKIMSILNDISENLQKGKAKIVKELVQQAIDEGVKPADILSEGLLSGMGIIGEKFKNNEVYVPEVLVAARAMNMGTQVLKPYLATEGIEAIGKVCIGTVQGDLHDIGKNLVKMMMEGKGLEVVDLGTDVSAETFIKTAIEQNCQIICCSALLTTTMNVMAEVVKAAEEAGIRDKVMIMVGGAPVNQDFCQKIGADCYAADAATAADAAADAAAAFCKA